MVQQSNPERANSSIAEYSPRPGTLRSNTLEVTDEPWTKNTTGRAGSPAFGAPTRLRYIQSGTSPFFAQYSLLQISPPSAAVARVLCVGSELASPPATKPSPAPLMTVRRASGRSNFSMIFSQSDCLIFLQVLSDAAARPANVRIPKKVRPRCSKPRRFAEVTLRCSAQPVEGQARNSLAPVKERSSFPAVQHLIDLPRNAVDAGMSR